MLSGEIYQTKIRVQEIKSEKKTLKERKKALESILDEAQQKITDL